MNPAVEIARILLEFEIELIAEQKAAASQVSEAQDAATSDQATEATRPGNDTPRPVKQQKAGVR